MLATDDLDEKERHVAVALDVAGRFGDSDLEFDALAYTGVVLVERGRFEGNLRQRLSGAALRPGHSPGGAIVTGSTFTNGGRPSPKRSVLVALRKCSDRTAHGPERWPTHPPRWC